MIDQQTCFSTFSISLESYELPTRFTFPLCYQPHPLCLLAAKELQQKLGSSVENATALQQAFIHTGKMFGVLLVENQQGELGYLCAYSGKQLSDNDTLKSAIKFVPSIVDIDVQNDFYAKESEVINQLNNQVGKLESAIELGECKQSLILLSNQQDEQLEQQRNSMALNRQMRKEARSQVRDYLVGTELAQALKQLAQQSINDKNQLRDLKFYWADSIEPLQKKLNGLTDEIKDLKNTRKRLSTRLQKKLFKQYRLLNSAGVEKDLMEIFQQTPFPMPPAGTGDCAAPKLLQYAFKQQLKPLAMAEFWWGKAPESEIRQHKKFYGACSGKCQPILTHMLEGMTLDENPLLVNPALGKELDIIYQDDAIVVVNKPSEFLSVPGKNIEDSVYLRIKQQFPQATGSLIVHRLDMSTSGLMVLALTKRAQKSLQQQFINRTIKKCYVAILEGEISENDMAKGDNQKNQKTVNQMQGEINLPLRGDFDDRPRQLVCFKHGKSAKTQWQIIDTLDGKTKLYLYPETGRTHQLRVHCAHPQGLNMPILGDDLYGGKEHGNKENRNSNDDSHSCADNKQTQRLHLHAQKLTLSHPITKEAMTFEITADF